MLRQSIFLLCLAILAACRPTSGRTSAEPVPTYDTTLPFPIPASCPQSVYAGRAALTPEMLSAAPDWIARDMLSAGKADGPVWRSGDNSVVWTGPATPPLVEANLLEGTSLPAVVKFTPGEASIFHSTISFPKNGCWEIIGTSGAARLRFIVYVYPAKFLQ